MGILGILRGFFFANFILNLLGNNFLGGLLLEFWRDFCLGDFFLSVFQIWGRIF